MLVQMVAMDVQIGRIGIATDLGISSF